MSDSNGYVYDKEGIKLDVVKEIKIGRRGRIKEYVDQVPSAEYHEGCSGIWTIPCDIALPCATQNEIDEESAKILVKNGVFAVGEGANMPTTIEGTKVFQENGVLFAPGKASNAGGVSVSALEMIQNSLSGRPCTWMSMARATAMHSPVMVRLFMLCPLSVFSHRQTGGPGIDIWRCPGRTAPGCSPATGCRRTPSPRRYTAKAESSTAASPRWCG